MTALTRGRELKCGSLQTANTVIVTALTRGRELKFTSGANRPLFT